MFNVELRTWTNVINLILYVRGIHHAMCLWITPWLECNLGYILLIKEGCFFFFLVPSQGEYDHVIPHLWEKKHVPAWGEAQWGNHGKKACSYNRRNPKIKTHSLNRPHALSPLLGKRISLLLGSWHYILASLLHSCSLPPQQTQNYYI